MAILKIHVQEKSVIERKIHKKMKISYPYRFFFRMYIFLKNAILHVVLKFQVDRLSHSGDTAICDNWSIEKLGNLKVKLVWETKII